MGYGKAPTDDAILELCLGARTAGLQLPDAALDQFRIYIDTLLLWRRRVSLITADSAAAIVCGHILDSIAVVRFVKPRDRVVDLGSGAGFPGVPIAITCPEARVFLVESRRKKANFLREVLRLTRLQNAQVVEARAEDPRPLLREDCQVVVSRAVWRLEEFLEMCTRYLRQHGVAVAMKGPKGAVTPAFSTAAFSGPEIIPYTLHGGRHRTLVVYRKSRRS